LRRAAETACCLPCSTVVILPELREIGFGEWTGKTWSEIEAQWPALAAAKLKDWQGVTSPDGETWKTFAERIRRAWDRIRRGPSPAAIVAHSGVNAMLAHLATGCPVTQFQQQYGEINEITYDAD